MIWKIRFIINTFKCVEGFNNWQNHLNDGRIW